MNGGASIVFYLLALLLPLAALVARRPPTRTVIRLALIWAAIFGVGLLLVISFT